MKSAKLFTLSLVLLALATVPGFAQTMHLASGTLDFLKG